MDHYGSVYEQGNGVRMKAIEKELQKIKKAEKRLCRQAEKKTTPLWKTKLEEKISDKVINGLQKAFSKAFYLIFEKGVVIIEKTYDRDSIEKDFQIWDYALELKGGRKEIRQMKMDSVRANALGTMVTTVEGIGLGVLGIGIPDIVLWVSVLLRRVNETALKYGFAYETPGEKMFILKMLETAMLAGESWKAGNASVDIFIDQDAHAVPTDEELKSQIEMTANAFATDMLVTKFIQGLPVAGIIGGAMNPIYYNKIINYVQLKYRKRYLIQKLR